VPIADAPCPAAEHPDSTANGGKVLRTGTQAKEFLIQNDIDPDSIALFDFSQMYGADGELTEHGRKRIAAGSTGRGRGRGKRRGGRLGMPKVKRQKSMELPTSNHPLSRVVQIVHDTMTLRDAHWFTRPVQAREAPGYFDKIKEPMDLGTIFSNLQDCTYLNAHQVRKDVTLVWKNCLAYNGRESEITHIAEELARYFDERFDEDISVPQHQGMKHFNQGEGWINKKVECYWDEDKEWYTGVIAEYDASKQNAEGVTTPYRIKYDEDDQDEWMDLPTKDVAITDDWEGMAEPIEPWEGFIEPNKVLSKGGRAQRSRTTTKTFTPTVGPAGNPRTRGGKRGRPAAYAAEVMDDDEGMDAGANHDAEQWRGDSERISSDFVCDDGLPSGDVCRCRLLFWCRFKTRKGMTLAPKGSSKNMGAKIERCSYINCPHPSISSNDRWHFISQQTASGGRDWSDLWGQTLCSSCFQQYRGKGTLLRARDSLGN
jgi:hypothetical protein